MPFYRINDPGLPLLTAHMNFGPKGGPAACVFPDFDFPSQRCARMSEALCDGPAGVDLAGKPQTCDAPMCKFHRTNIEPAGDIVGGGKDLCPRCVAKGKQ